MKTILFLCPDDEKPSGGVRRMYRYVDILNEAGFAAYILHQKEGFRCRWFENNTRIAYVVEDKVAIQGRLDYLVLPEIFGPTTGRIGRGIRKVILNQNPYLTFRGYSFDKDDFTTPYLDPETVAVLVVSHDSEQYLRCAFPKQRIVRIHYSVDPNFYRYHAQKKPRIAFMPRKNPEDLLQVINILKFRGALKEYEIVSIDKVPEQQVAEILRETLIFLCFSHPEGWGLPAAEAMSSGCVVIGYHGMGGMEYFKEEFCHPIEYGDILGFARTVEDVLGLHRKNPAALVEKGRLASEFMRRNHHPDQEKKDLLNFWTNLA